MPREPQPFTLPHFRRWTSDLVLDNGSLWVLEPFQAAFVRDFFEGRPENWLLLPEGNAKTTLLAGLGLYHCEFTPSAWVPVGASSRDQARILYRQASGFVNRTPRLKAMFRCFDGYRRIVHKASDGMLEVFANDDRTGDGVIPTLALIDELHRHRDLSLYQTWAGKLDKRQGQLITISTAGEPGSEFEQTRERIRQQATKVTRKGAFVRAASPTLLLHEWAVPENGDVEDVRVVKQANPLKAITVDRLRAKLERPTMTTPHWRRFTCNLPTRSDSSAITEAEWDAARYRLKGRTPVETWEATVPINTPIWLGLDVAWKWDTTALAPYYVGSDFRLLGPATVLTPPRDGSMLKVDRVKDALLAIHARTPLHTVVMDTSSAEDIAQWIERECGSEVIERGGNRTTDHIQDFERFMEGLRSGQLRHCGDDDLTAHALNAIARIDRFGVARFDRSSPNRNGGAMQERRVIDALTAAAMVHAQAMVEEIPSVYTEERGLVEL